MFARFMGDSVRMIYVEVDPDANLDNIITQIELLLVKRHDVTLDSADFTVTTQQDIISTQESTTAAFRSLLAWVAGVSLIVGGIGIMNIMLVSVTERTREIGLRKAVGARSGSILLQFLVESAMLSVIGGLIGMGLAWILGLGVTALTSSLNWPSQGGLPTPFPLVAAILATLFSAMIGVVFGLYPAVSASQLDPIVALRRE